MLNDAVCFQSVYIVYGYTDFQSGMDRLAALIETRIGKPPTSRIPCTFSADIGQPFEPVSTFSTEQE